MPPSAILALIVSQGDGGLHLRPAFPSWAMPAIHWSHARHLRGAELFPPDFEQIDREVRARRRKAHHGFTIERAPCLTMRWFLWRWPPMRSDSAGPKPGAESSRESWRARSEAADGSSECRKTGLRGQRAHPPRPRTTPNEAIVLDTPWRTLVSRDPMEDLILPV